MKYLKLSVLVLAMVISMAGASATTIAANNDNKEIVNNNASALSKAQPDYIELRKYVENLSQNGYDVLHDASLSQTAKKKKASEMIRAHLYLDWMAKHSLGRYRRTVSKDKIEEFTKVYAEFVVDAYSDLVTHYNGEKAIIKQVKKVDDNLFLVGTEITNPKDRSIVRIEYLVHQIAGNKSDQYMVGDIITEGISVLSSQQSEFASIIASKGIDSLISDLKRHTIDAVPNSKVKPTGEDKINKL